MKIGLENVVLPKEEIVEATAKQFLQAEIEMIEAGVEFDKHLAMYECLVKVGVDVEDVRTVIAAHGINDTIVALLGDELATLPGFDTKDAAQVTIALEANLKDLGAKILELLQKIWTNVIIFFGKIFNYTKIAIPLAKKYAAIAGKIGSDAEWKSEKTFKLLKDQEKFDNTTNQSLTNAKIVAAELKTKSWKGVNAAYKDIVELESVLAGEKDYVEVSTAKEDAAEYANAAEGLCAKFESTVKVINTAKPALEGVKFDALKTSETEKYDVKAVVTGAARDLRTALKQTVSEIKVHVSIWANIKAVK